MMIDEKYNVRVSTRHYKGPELLTNDTVMYRLLSSLNRNMIIL